ncbi:MAG: lactate utilization protein [Proteobacteria bacterium]|nr:lactate utilization protein [Pseudomonadota bacterium]MBU1741946.1 lactate utilization protein [Pseudomonadota bacterium]
MVAKFSAELQAVGGVYHQAADEAGVTEVIARILADEKPGPVLVDRSSAAWMPETDRETILYSGDRDDNLIARAATCAIGIGRAMGAVAESGSVVVAAAHGRAVSLLPWCQVTILRAQDIYPTVGDCLAALSGEKWASLGSSLSFITGPSKTGDIESTLVLGVHGPGRVHVIVLKGDFRGQD